MKAVLEKNKNSSVYSPLRSTPSIFPLCRHCKNSYPCSFKHLSYFSITPKFTYLSTLIEVKFTRKKFPISSACWQLYTIMSPPPQASYRTFPTPQKHSLCVFAVWCLTCPISTQSYLLPVIFSRRSCTWNYKICFMFDCFYLAKYFAGLFMLLHILVSCKF